MSEKIRRKFTLDFKRAALLKVENRDKGVTVEAIAKELGVSTSQLYNWRDQVIDEAAGIPRTDKPKKKKSKKKIPIKVIVKPKNGKASVMEDAIVYLRHARETMKKAITNDNTKLEDPVYPLVLLALNTLEGKSVK